MSVCLHVLCGFLCSIDVCVCVLYANVCALCFVCALSLCSVLCALSVRCLHGLCIKKMSPLFIGPLCSYYISLLLLIVVS